MTVAEACSKISVTSAGPDQENAPEWFGPQYLMALLWDDLLHKLGFQLIMTDDGPKLVDESEVDDAKP
jgi:hypothetical protein